MKSLAISFLSPARFANLADTYGLRRPGPGDPVQYDELRIEHDQGNVEIIVYDRAILLFFTDSEAVKRSHQVCCRLDDLVIR